MIKRGRPPGGNNEKIALIEHWREAAMFAGILTPESETAATRLQASLQHSFPQRCEAATEVAQRYLDIDVENFRIAAGDQQSTAGSR